MRGLENSFRTEGCKVSGVGNITLSMLVQATSATVPYQTMF